ncbi:glycosyltransferase family 4 protein (plasmid) [Bradyrhizobium sp. ISRA443]|uniref:glycosyltransferase family 4 protein n=1 Tax=unclassified Bradyrhizobium TaxID=2631580 RepID=UPI00247948BC|nr:MULTISPECIES: glycosyltransferase family 4 protein [unclassified Bradyrhizobium]WGR90746.1 glycosyltransferase family 4 protein [Bradyrhizobium sp. ISRA435]WGS03120.1 glycosyltransferase family 4 protein [Bradyrhizobium sp. ISRA436]WGS10085.1 glycosyltransferase family 4 protein [Bradyrhizobium sp. ISRA437]WGS16971.1 glycosyltransferase family 4 protein [Bradyrhizobium sp. ISRA443]
MRKLLFLASEDWFFARHFLPMARKVRTVGFEVAVAARITDHGTEIANEGLRVVPIDFNRGHFQSLVPLHAVKQLIQTIRQERPDVIHCIGLPLVVLGGIAARLAGVKALVLAPTGLGHLWTADSKRATLLRPFVRVLVGRTLNGKTTHYVFENHEDHKEFGLTARNSSLTFVSGAGTDPTVFCWTDEPSSPPIKVAVVSRMLRSKGIVETVQAVRLAISRGVNLELHLFGAPDPSNPTSLSTEELQQLSSVDGVWWHGYSTDIPGVWRDHHIAMLLSHREGLPNSLVEAAACGRPIVTCDVVGCREVVRNGVDGFLVSKNEITEAADRLAELARSTELRRRMGAEARGRFLNEFTVEKVSETIASLYRKL